MRFILKSIFSVTLSSVHNLETRSLSSSVGCVPLMIRFIAFSARLLQIWCFSGLQRKLAFASRSFFSSFSLIDRVEIFVNFRCRES